MAFNVELHGWMVIKLIVGMFGVLFFLRYQENRKCRK